MKLTVTRQQGTALSTPGLLDIDGVFQCYTLEPRMDRSRGKPYAIPAGDYALVLERSPHFSAIMGYDFVTPHVLGVPGFDYIEIHPGNKPADTRGCCLVGQTRATDFVGNSREAFDALMAKLTPAHAAGESITIEYIDAPADTCAKSPENAPLDSRGSGSDIPSVFAVTDPELGL